MNSLPKFIIFALLLFVFACTKEGTVEVYNKTGIKIVSIINGNSQILDNFQTQTKTIKWTGTEDETIITLSVQAFALGTSYTNQTRTITLHNGGITRHTWN